MSEQPTSPAWTDADETALVTLLIRAAYGLATAAEIAERRESKKRHPAGRAIPVAPIIPEDIWQPAPPLPNWSGLGRFISISLAIALILAGFLIGVTQHPWVAIGLVTAGCAIGARLATVHHRMGEKS